MTGRELCRLALQRRPGLAVLFATGYAPDATIRQGVLEPDVHVLMKPYTLDMLATAIDKLLAAKGINASQGDG
jgi:CheY-like chemotaxis protein